MKLIMLAGLILFMVMENRALALELKSIVFQHNAYIPLKYSCKAEDFSPPLSWTGAPQGTVSFALICDDPDAPSGDWVHWVIFNIPASKASLPENISKTGTLADGSVQGINDFTKLGYGGPCPPPGKPHRYFFKLYALDAQVPLKAGASKRDLLRAMDGHILAQAELVGLFKR
jgi:hypothetical protein